MKPAVGKSIFFSLIAIIALFISLAICTAALSFVLVLLSKIPILKNILSFFLYTTEQSGYSLVAYLALAFSVIFVSWLLARIHDEDATLSLTYRISAVVLFVISIWAVISAIKENSAIYGSLLLVVCSVVAFIYGHKLKSKVSSVKKTEKNAKDETLSKTVNMNLEFDDRYSKERLDSILGKRINPYNRKPINTIEDLIEYDRETDRRILQEKKAELEKSKNQ